MKGLLGFVWHARGARQRKTAESAHIFQVVAHLVAVHQRKTATGRQFVERNGLAPDADLFGAGFHAGLKQLCFHGPGATETPGGTGHFPNQREFDIIAGPETGNEDVDDILERATRFGVHGDASGEQPMADGVAGGAGLTQRGLGPSRPGSVGAGGKNTFFGNHKTVRG